MAGKQSLYEKQLERMAKAFGEDLIAFLNKDELLEQMPPDIRVRGLTLEERLSGLDLDAETLEKLKELINGQEEVSS